jgi:hypothetical protein
MELQTVMVNGIEAIEPTDYNNQTMFMHCTAGMSHVNKDIFIVKYLPVFKAHNIHPRILPLNPVYTVDFVVVSNAIEVADANYLNGFGILKSGAELRSRLVKSYCYDTNQHVFLYDKLVEFLESLKLSYEDNTPNQGLSFILIHSEYGKQGIPEYE